MKWKFYKGEIVRSTSVYDKKYPIMTITSEEIDIGGKPGHFCKFRSMGTSYNEDWRPITQLRHIEKDEAGDF